MREARLWLCCGLVMIVGSLAGAATAPAKQARATRCRATIVKATASYIDAQTTALRKCWDAVVVGRQVAPCPDAKGQNVIAKAKAKLDALVNKACGGADKICGTDTAPDIALGVIGWNIGSCPGGDVCDDPIADCTDIAACVVCVADRAVAQSFDLFYQPAVFPVADKRLRKCVREFGKSSATVLSNLARGFASCWLAVNKSESGGSFSCPDAKSSNAIAKAKGKHVTAVCNACGGGSACGGGFAPASLGFPLQCPAIGACGGPVQTMREAASCVDCVAGVVTDGAARISIPAFTSPPPQCLVLP